MNALLATLSLQIAAIAPDLASSDPHPAPATQVDAPARAAPSGRADYLFPREGHVATTAATGVPFYAIGEVAYGISDRFALGAIGGVTPHVAGFGLRPRGVLFEQGALRATLLVPVLYYPRTKDLGGEPWMLTNPTLRMEVRLSDDVSVNGGVGVVAAACVLSLFGIDDDDDMGPGFMGGVWNTIPVGASFSVTPSLVLFADAQAVFHGLRLAGSEWVGGPPVIASLGATLQL